MRTVAYGYRYGEVILPALKPIKEDVVIMVNPFCQADKLRRPAIATSLGCHVEGASLPHADPSDRDSMIAGVKRRAACKPPPADFAALERLGCFVDQWLEDNLTPLAPSVDFSVETWLASTNYPEWRKEELRQKWEEVDDIEYSKDYYKVKCFMKDEVYEDWKYPRGIYARVDEFKAFIGPVFKQIEKDVYENKHFIKHVPVKDRPRVIYERLNVIGSRAYATDYTSFESLFQKQLMSNCEFKLYAYMLRHTPGYIKIMKVIYDVIGGQNYCSFHTFVMLIFCTRMSGEMNTSLGNGFSNLMFWKFNCFENGNTYDDVFVEGDDGLGIAVGPPLTDAMFTRLGLNIKLEIHDDISTASFCGMIFDIDDLIVVTNPIATLVGFGWSKMDFVMARQGKLNMLLEAKAISLVYEYAGCPVLTALARYVLRVSPRQSKLSKFIRNHRGFNTYDRETLLPAASHWLQHQADFVKRMNLSPPIATRLLVEKKFGLSVEDQLSIENYLDSLQVLTPLSHSAIIDNCSEVWKQYSRDYVKGIVSRDEFERPIELNVQRADFRKEM